MLEAEGLIKSLSASDADRPSPCPDDHDPCTVFSAFGYSGGELHRLRFSDGSEKAVTLDG